MKTSKIGLATFAFLFVAGIASILLFSHGLRVDARAVERMIMTPYANALHASEWERAWQSFTTESYRARTSLDAYRSAYTERARAHGGVASISCPTMSGMRRGARDVIIAATCRLRYTDGTEQPVRYSLLGNGEHLAIDSANDGIW